MSEEIKIDRNIPIPNTYQNGLTGVLKKLKVGDSFECPSWSANIYTLANKVKIKVLVRKQENGFYRIWRKS